jgi:pimeloyl-ACP methyl ester carboxylesterase
MSEECENVRGLTQGEAVLEAPPTAWARKPASGFASTHAVNWVFPQWVKSLTTAGRRVIAFDNRGHGRSEKIYDPAAYTTQIMAEDARAVLDHLDIEVADVMGYSMGARIAAFLAKAHKNRLRSMILGGLGHHLVDRGSLPPSIAEAMEAPALADLTDPCSGCSAASPRRPRAISRRSPRAHEGLANL